jgi:hypothetical protein
MSAFISVDDEEDDEDQDGFGDIAVKEKVEPPPGVAAARQRWAE